MTTNYKQAKAIFLEALHHMPANGRDSYIERACADDVDLRSHVLALLQEHAAAGQLATRAIQSVAARVAPAFAEAPGTIIGRYKLQEQIGEGGMGVVYLAEQKEPVRRTVALKVIKPGMDTRQVVARFEAERQALAMMNHPNIAKVLDAGATEAGRPYFVMELVKGAPITEFCDEKKLDTRERLQLFITLCQAVQHAHQKGLIHRDLKPSNVLVEMHDVRPVPKVIDFGVAKAIGQQLTEKTLLTGFSQMVGTPLYMSPEQAGQSSIDVDTRSDIYSLGVLLYEILTGQTPFENETLRQAGLDEMRRKIREVDPPRPSARISTLEANALSTVSDRRKVEPHKLSQQLRGELDCIVMKALEKDRNRRYESASALARDVERYLADEVVEARPASAGYRMKKLLRRHKGPVIAASLLLIALVVTTLLSLALAARERELGTRRQELVVRQQVVQQGINEALSEVARLRGQVHADPKNARTALAKAREQMQRAVALAEAGPSPPEVTARVRILLDELDREYVDAAFSDVLDEAWLARANTDPRQNRWAPEQCVPILSKAMELRGVRVGKAPPEQVAAVVRMMPESVRTGLIVALEEWAHSRSISHRTRLRLVSDESTSDSSSPKSDVDMGQYDKIVAIQDGRDAEMKKRGPGMSLMKIGRHLSPPPGAIVRLQVIRRGQREAETYEVVPDPMQAWLRAVVNAVDTDPWRKRMRAAFDLTDTAERLRTFRELADGADVERQPVRTLTTLSEVLMSETDFDRAIELSRQVQQKSPGDVHANLNLALALGEAKPPQLVDSARYYTAAIALCPSSACTHNNLGVVMRDLGRPEEAIRQYHEALRLQPNFLMAATNLADLLEKQGREDEAMAELRKFVAVNPDHGRARFELGTKLLELGNLEEAIVELSEAARLDPNQSPQRINLASALRRNGKFEEAILQYHELLRILPASVRGRRFIAETLAEQGKLEEAITEYRDILRVDPDDPETLNNFAYFLATAADLNWRNPAEALVHASRVVELAPRKGEVWNTLGVAKYRNGAWQEALAALNKSEELAPRGDVSNWLFLAMAHWQLGEKEEARSWYDKAAAWMKDHAPNNEVTRICTEADELLGIGDKPSSVPQEPVNPPDKSEDQK